MLLTLESHKLNYCIEDDSLIYITKSGRSSKRIISNNYIYGNRKKKIKTQEVEKMAMFRDDDRADHCTREMEQQQEEINRQRNELEQLRALLNQQRQEINEAQQ